MIDYKPDVDHKPEGADHNNEPVAYEQEEENSDAKYVKMELPCQGTLIQ